MGLWTFSGRLRTLIGGLGSFRGGRQVPGRPGDATVMPLRGYALGLALSALVGLSGCAISASTSAVLDSSLASSASPSREVRAAAYHDDIRDLTASHVATGGSFQAFQRQLGDLARKHGISDWEEETATYTAIGHGLAKAGADGAALDAYTRELAVPDSDGARAIRAAYAGERLAR